MTPLSVCVHCLLQLNPQEPVTADERQMGKRINFGVLYGESHDAASRDRGPT